MKLLLTSAGIKNMSAGMPLLCYAVDDQTAIKVTDSIVEAVSDGHWRLFTPDTE